MDIKLAILLDDSVRYSDTRYAIEYRYLNGIVVGRSVTANYLAVHQVRLKVSASLRAVVGIFDQGGGFIYPGEESKFTWPSEWMAELKAIHPLDWQHRLRHYLAEVGTSKIKVDGYSLDDLVFLRDHGLYVGFSALKPFHRVYALLPADGDELRAAIKGKVTPLKSFGALFNPQL